MVSITALAHPAAPRTAGYASVRVNTGDPLSLVTRPLELSHSPKSFLSTTVLPLALARCATSVLGWRSTNAHDHREVRKKVSLHGHS